MIDFLFKNIKYYLLYYHILDPYSCIAISITPDLSIIPKYTALLLLLF